MIKFAPTQCKWESVKMCLHCSMRRVCQIYQSWEVEHEATTNVEM